MANCLQCLELLYSTKRSFYGDLIDVSPRDALQSAVLAVVECPSVTIWHCVKVEKRIVKLSKPHHSPILIVTQDTKSLPKLQRHHPKWGRQMQVVNENAIFDQYLTLSQKRYKTGPQLL